MTNYYERLKQWYAWNFVRKDQLQMYTKLGVITPEEYEDITGEPYEEPTVDQ